MSAVRRAGLTCLLLALAAPLAATVTAGTAPDTAADAVAEVVLLVTGADHRGDHLGAAFAGVDIDTPQLDALARRGALFTRAWAGSSLPTAALAGLHTGRSPRDIGLLDHGARLVDEAPRLSQAMAAAGYDTVAVIADPEAGLALGFGVGFEQVLGAGSGERLSALEAVAQASAALERRSGRRVFLWLHLADGAWPHRPAPGTLRRYHDPEDDPRHEGMRPARLAEGAYPPELDGVADLAWAEGRYKACLTELDAALAPLLARPRVAAGVVAYLGVTGVLLGEHGLWFRRLGCYPGSLNVPLVLAGPGVPAGLREAAPVSSVDLGRTLLDLAGAAAIPFPGRSLLAGERPGQVFAVDVGGASVGVTDGEHVVLLSLQRRRRPWVYERHERGSSEGFLLAGEVPGQPLLLAPGSPARQELTATLLAWLGEAEALGWGQDARLSASARERLAATGYVSPPPAAAPDPWNLSDAGRLQDGAPAPADTDGGAASDGSDGSDG